MRTVNIEPNWSNMFRAAEAQLQSQDFDGQAFVLEMFQFGMRCYERQQQQSSTATNKVWTVADQTIGAINKNITQGFELIKKGAIVELERNNRNSDIYPKI